MAEEMTLGDVDLTTVKARTVSGIVTLISRSFLLQFVATGGFLALSIFLGRPEIGLFIAVNDLVSILGYFSDIGLAASLIQKKDQVTITDLRTTFTIQQIIVLLLLLLTLGVSPWIFSFYHISNNGTWLFYSLLAAFFLASLKTIPSVILERKLQFKELAAVEVVETIIFYGIAVLLAWQGGGVISYAWAVIFRGVVGTAMIYWLSPWKIGLSFSISSLKSLLSFGLPYQINSLVATVKDRFINIILWKIIGADGVGIIGWAQTWSQKPLRFIMDNVTRVTFPSFARLQDNPVELRRAIERTLFFITLITFPIVAGLAVFAPQLVLFIPRYSKWQPALLALTLYCFNSALASVSTPLTNTLNALGRVKTNTYLMFMWTALTWILVPSLAHRFGYNGVAYATALIALTSIIPVIIVKRLTGFSLINSFVKPALATVAMILVALVGNILLGVAAYAIVVYLLVGPALFTDARKLLHAFRR
ncbi:MAG: Polysaccharide biosynthesis protein [Candidatus Amesbacteria bacterium GW2011_GWA2_47_11b]|uniref:Polysaccharide biosynthesis protein n=3 Tax=Candidatus Amesiibacteriota TaxID=1752730 RepID=A0A0G1SLF7_9BACT|nr:MAG: Polysaccharide biosynthesis protein [Microgenomates group bacterium GW2011_GWC1_46_20]KKU58237.1 MAG: Polysaccharide biosynthesis protein [Candidatus Amesbacteria bacterium GW2011_GWA2_47_11b]KKU70287.1 MAG: Polysaccharide biosynthesis protein [Candidatus Amesbacteria bacterium GW2011_GWA1_47_20]KKU82878.1 MAG: Polysaccharide biosynthesis protein [Candidatus Amesbacteria bacterium GW2011_GWC2_47_8]